MAVLVFKLISSGDRERCEQLLEITDFAAKCVGVSWGPYDETLISWHDDGTIYIWDAETGAKVAEAKHFEKRVTAVEFPPDRAFCLCSSHDKTAKLLFSNNLEVVRVRRYSFSGACEIVISCRIIARTVP